MATKRKHDEDEIDVPEKQQKTLKKRLNPLVIDHFVEFYVLQEDKNTRLDALYAVSKYYYNRLHNFFEGCDLKLNETWAKFCFPNGRSKIVLQKTCLHLLAHSEFAIGRLFVFAKCSSSIYDNKCNCIRTKPKPTATTIFETRPAWPWVYVEAVHILDYLKTPVVVLEMILNDQRIEAYKNKHLTVERLVFNYGVVNENRNKKKLPKGEGVKPGIREIEIFVFYDVKIATFPSEIARLKKIYPNLEKAKIYVTFVDSSFLAGRPPQFFNKIYKGILPVIEAGVQVEATVEGKYEEMGGVYDEYFRQLLHFSVERLIPNHNHPFEYASHFEEQYCPWHELEFNGAKWHFCFTDCGCPVIDDRGIELFSFQY
ncbi:unnamed protein product [Bursaphelenchus xylophilus]|uniref:(pine wood nematode) hypothetical protein n=1 Tax=Bursaphelenchus xylophilus TaxID=6326 RepID=A0A1I7RPG9_BURXY|nr:unnamed protein product [Bursaphelenchus xylophilus]CAG9096001.1 unnamed protein product [Bursaphelenchus xylophilus]